MTIMHVKTYLISILISIAMYLLYQCYIKKPERAESKKLIKKTKQFQYAPGVIVQKMSSYHMTQPEHMNQFEFPRKSNNIVKDEHEVKNVTCILDKKSDFSTTSYHLKDIEDLNKVEISLSNVSTPKKKIEMLSIEQVNKIPKKVDTNNILKDLDKLSLEIGEKKNIKTDFKSKVHAVANKEESKSDEKDCDKTLSLDSERLAENVALHVIGGKTEIGFKENMDSKNVHFSNVRKGQNPEYFSPYVINNWGPPVQFSGNISPVRMTPMPNMNNMNNGNFLQPMMPMSPLGSMHHLNQLNGAVLMNAPIQNNQSNQMIKNKSQLFPRPNIW